MYLTRFRVNTARVASRRLLSSPQVLHAAVLSSFAVPVCSDGDGPRVLWRLDRTSRPETFLYIVSPSRPDLTHLVEQVGWPTASRWETYDYTPFLARLATGDRWRFRLTANPVHSIRRNDSEPTKLTAHVTPAHQAEWLLRRQESAGFRLVEKPPEQRLLPEGDEYQLVVHDRRQLNFRKKRESKRVTLLAVSFDGQLEVTDPEAFRRALTRGIGRGKAYGCGLMTLAAA